MRSISEQKSNYLASGWLTLLALLSQDIAKGGGPLDDENDISLLKINTNLILILANLLCLPVLLLFFEVLFTLATDHFYVH